jgi:16S rRNA (cytidine1402-2'-O)-methyltransferase
MSALTEISEEPALYVVATPIGNLDDLSNRAIQILRQVDLIAAEDTRHSRGLLAGIGSRAKLIAAHAHNERSSAQTVVKTLVAGQSCALISDAGTPAISDPGARLVHAVRQAGFRVVPVPGACSPVALLSVAGIDEDRFGSNANRWLFAGFLPTRSKARLDSLTELKRMQASVVLLESPKRIEQLIQAIQAIFEGDRQVIMGRELTKKFEETAAVAVADLLDWFHADSNRERGEYVLVIAPPARSALVTADDDTVTADTGVTITTTTGELMSRLVQYLPAAKAARLASRLSGLPRDTLYNLAVEADRSADNKTGKPGESAAERSGPTKS